MGVSRATFGRILDSARRKSATALVLGMAIAVECAGSSAKEEVCECPSCRRAASRASGGCRGGNGDSAWRTCCGAGGEDRKDEGCIPG
jgi:hypothetical protein